MSTYEQDFVSLDELRSVLNTYAGPDSPRERLTPHGLRRVRPVFVVALAVAALVGAGAAIADGFGAFDGIGVADHPQTVADMIDPATAAYLTGTTPQSADVMGLQLDSARHLGQLQDGQNIYVIPRNGDGSNLCTVVGPPHPEIECNSTLNQSHPTTIFTYSANQPAAAPVTFGVALDGVTSVSFQAGAYPNGQEVTVPVNDNLWIYPGVVYALQPVTSRFADGTTVVEPGQGAGCAAC
jgi:hypothetical protein